MELYIILNVVDRNAGAFWSIKFSRCGRYLAAAGQDRLVRIWCMSTDESDESVSKINGGVYAEKPLRYWAGHTDEVLEINELFSSFIFPE